VWETRKLLLESFINYPPFFQSHHSEAILMEGTERIRENVRRILRGNIINYNFIIPKLRERSDNEHRYASTVDNLSDRRGV